MTVGVLPGAMRGIGGGVGLWVWKGSALVHVRDLGGVPESP